MKNILLTITVLLTSLLNAQVNTLKLKEFYKFQVLKGLDPLVEYLDNRETKLMGGVTDIEIKFDETNKKVTLTNNTFNTVNSFPIISKLDSTDKIVSYKVLGPKGYFQYLLSNQTNGDVNVYCSWNEGMYTKSWVSVGKLN